MKCPSRRISYASWRLQTFRQLFLPSTPLHLTRISNRDFSSSPPSPPETKTKAKSSPATKGGKKERGEVKRPSELLPQSPLIANPRLVDPGSYKKRKRRADPSELQDLRNNPWAVALTSPIRYCAATKTRIPVAFMGDWGLVQEDGSDALWMLPVGLLGPELGGTRMDAQKEGQGQGQGQSEGVNAGGGDGAKKKQLPAEPTQSRRALTLRMVDRVPIIKEFSASFSRENKSPEARSSAVRLFPSDWKYPRGPITAKHEKRVVWRKDMPEFLLEKLRRMVLEKVTKAAGRWKRTGDGHGAWTPFDLDSDAHGSDALVEGLKRLGSIEKMESGGVLVIGSPSKNTSIPVEGEQPSSAFPDYVTLPQTQSKVPVFDLGVLFSEVELEELKNFYKGFRTDALFLRPNHRSIVDAMLALWKLKNSLREGPQ